MIRPALLAALLAMTGCATDPAALRDRGPRGSGTAQHHIPEAGDGGGGGGSM